jgi:heme exporter protein C
MTPSASRTDRGGADPIPRQARKTALQAPAGHDRSTSANPYARGLRPLSVATVLAMVLALALVFFYAPLEAEQGFLQKIFYVHVPFAIVALCGFVLGGLLAIVYLRTRDPRWDMRSYVAIHMSLIFAVGTLITGSIWAKGSWGHWWVWSEPTLVTFLIIFLLYATYQPLRFAIEDPERQARYAAVFAITAAAFVPMNYAAVNLSTAYVHPRVFSNTSNLPGSMALTLLAAVIAMALLFVTLCKYELAAKHTRFALRALRRRLLEDSPVPGAPARSPLSPVATPAPATAAVAAAARASLQRSGA